MLKCHIKHRLEFDANVCLKVNLSLKNRCSHIYIFLNNKGKVRRLQLSHYDNPKQINHINILYFN